MALPCPPRKAKNFGKTMKTLFSYLAPYKFRVAMVFLFAVLSTVFTIISPTVLGAATDKVVEGIMAATGVDFGGLLNILMALLAMYLLSLAFGTFQGWIMADVSQKVIYTLRNEMSVKLDRLPLKYFDSKTHGEFQSRMVNDIETVNQTLSNSLTMAISSVATVAGTLIMMLRNKRGDDSGCSLSAYRCQCWSSSWWCRSHSDISATSRSIWDW